MSAGPDTVQSVRAVVRRSARWLFVNRQTGRITVAQWPNVPLGLFIAVALVQRLFEPAGSTGTVLRIVAAVALIVWSLDELLRGVNPFRRLLGLGILAATVVNVFM